MTVQFKGGPRDGETAEIKYPGNAVFHSDECKGCGKPVQRRYYRVGESRTFEYRRTHDCQISDLT